MALGIVSNEDFESEVNNSSVDYGNNSIDYGNTNIPNKSESDSDSDKSSPVVTSDVIIQKNPGRHPEVSNIPQSLRKILGETTAVEGLARGKELANALGVISQPTLSTYARGEVSRGVVNEDMTNYLNGRKTKISKRALNKLNLAISLIDETKLIGCEAKELSSVAKDMAIVAKQMEPSEKKEEQKDPVQFHFYAPQIRNENHYEVVNAKDAY